MNLRTALPLFIHEEVQGITILTYIPDLLANTVKVTLTEQHLIINAQIKTPHARILTARFIRQVKLPGGVDINHIQHHVRDDGSLSVFAPWLQIEHPRRLSRR